MNFDLKATLKPITDAVTNFVKNPVNSVGNFSGHVVKTVSNGGTHIFNTLNDIALKLTGNAPKVSFEKKDADSKQSVGITVMSNTGKLDDPENKDVNLRGDNIKQLKIFKRSIDEIVNDIKIDVHSGNLSVSDGKYALNHLQKETTKILNHLKTFDTKKNDSEARAALREILNKDTGSMIYIKNALKKISEKKDSTNIQKETVEANSASKNHTVKQTIVYGKNTPYRLVVEQRNSKRHPIEIKNKQATLEKLPINAREKLINNIPDRKDRIGINKQVDILGNPDSKLDTLTQVNSNDPLKAQLENTNLTSDKIDSNLNLPKQNSFNRNLNFLSQQSNFKASNPVVKEISLKMLEHLANPNTESSIFERDYETLKHFESIYPSNTPTGDIIDQALKLLDSKISSQSSESKNILKSPDSSKILNNETADQENKVPNTIIGQNSTPRKQLTINDLVKEINNTSFKNQTLLNNFNVASKEITKPNANLEKLDRYYEEFKRNQDVYREDLTNTDNSKMGYLVNQMLDILADKIRSINPQFKSTHIQSMIGNHRSNFNIEKST